MPALVQNIRGMLERSFVALPILLFGWSLFVGSTTGNIGLLVLSMGHATVVPLMTWLIHSFLTLPFINDFSQANFTVPASSTCRILPAGIMDASERDMAIPSYWLAHIYYFFGFLIANANGILNIPVEAGAPADKVERRKSQAQLILIMGYIFMVLFVAIRYFVMRCESAPGIFLGWIIFFWLGNGWYQLAKACSARDSDMFGIAQGILPASAYEPPPTTCVYTGK